MGWWSRLNDKMDAKLMSGFSPRSIRKQWSLIPMWICIYGGMGWAAVFSARTFFLNPDSMEPFTNKPNYEKYRDKQFLFFNISGLKLPCEAPIYKQPGDPSDDSYAQDWLKYQH